MFKYNSADINMSNVTSTPAPEGIYTLKIADTTEKVTKNNDPMISVRCEIDDTGEWLGTTVWHNVTFLADKSRRGAGMSIHFLKQIGEPWEGEFDVIPENWKGKFFRAKLKVTKDLKGNPRNEIAYVLDSGNTDDVPF